MLLKKIFILIIAFNIGSASAFALELDMSVDEEIKKKYNSSQLEYDVLPQLPKVYSNQSSPPKNRLDYSQTSVPAITKANPKKGIKIPSGTKFTTRSNTAISDWMQQGTSVSFTAVSSVYKKNITIPAGTVFTGTIVNSHQPQAAGNGGLAVIKITSMTYNGKTFDINAKITKANSKKIFLNNMKGERKYCKGIAGRINKGETFYKKAKQKAHKLADNSVLIILSPIPAITGALGCAVCTVLSPVTALTAKGGHLSIPSGSPFEIKLVDSVYINQRP